MKRKSNLLLFAMTSLIIAKPAYAMKYVIYTDQQSGEASQKVIDVMKSTYPFNKFNMEFEVVKVSSSELDCGSQLGIDRNVGCKNADSIQAKALARGGDQAMIVKDMAKHGGSSMVGGGVPVITTGSSPRVMLHEYMHTLGLCDEYEYKTEEADMYCEIDSKNPNLVFIAPEDPYYSDGNARQKHAFDIPWYKDIASKTPITNSGGKILGTGDVDFKKDVPPNNTNLGAVVGESSGLFKGQSCKKAKVPKVVWHPGAGSTIMDKTENGLGAPLEKIVERLLISKGATKKMELTETEIEAPAPKRRSASWVGEQSYTSPAAPAPMPPPEEVNDSGRGFFKSFMDMFQGILNNMTRALSK